MRRIYFTIFLLFIVLLPVFSDTFTAAGVQFEISSAVYKSRDTFFSAVEDEIKNVFEADSQPDLIIFPEYIGVFYQLIEYNDLIAGSKSFQEALIRVLQAMPEFGSLKELFFDDASVQSYLQGWKALAAEYEVTLVGGTCFKASENGRLFNTVHVFGPDGSIIYDQRKVFLTDFETDIIGLSAGEIGDVDSFSVKNRDIAVTICRDTYAREWEEVHSGAFLWIDIKANGEVYDELQRRSFMRALPSRMINTEVEYGMTVCAVGTYLDLLWQGESSTLLKENGQLYLIDLSRTHDQSDIIGLKIESEY